MRYFHKIASVLFGAILVASLSVPVFAAPADLVQSCVFSDTSHPFAFFILRSTTSECLTAHTGNGSKPTNKTPITTEMWDHENTNQYFERVTFTANGVTGCGWSAYSDANLVLNAYRSASTPEVNLANAIGNYRADIEMFHNDGYSTFRVAPRGSYQTTDRYIAQASAMPGNSGHYTYWNYTGTPFYQYEIGGARFL